MAENKKGTAVEDGEFKEVDGTEKKETRQKKVKKPIGERLHEFAENHPHAIAVGKASMRVLGNVAETVLVAFVTVKTTEYAGGFKFSELMNRTASTTEPTDVFDIPVVDMLPENEPTSMPTVEEPEKEYADEVIPE